MLTPSPAVGSSPLNDAARANYDTDKESKIAKLLEGDKLKRAQLEDELSALRLQMKMERTNRLAELSEAIAIAKSMGIKTPTTPSSMADAARGGSSQVMRTEVNNQKIPLFFLGTEALEAERVGKKVLEVYPDAGGLLDTLRANAAAPSAARTR